MTDENINKLEYWYVEKKLSLRNIGYRIGVSHVTVAKYLDRIGVVRRFGEKKVGKTLKYLSGRRFGKLRVMHRDGIIYPVKWICICDCGVVKSVSGHMIKTYKSCGCMRGRKKKNS